MSSDTPLDKNKPNDDFLDRSLKANPFQVQPISPELLLGRNSEIDIMFDQIGNRSHLAIYGGSGIGKSSLLRYASYPQAWQQRGLDYSKVLIVELNCRGIYPFKPSNFWREVVIIANNHINATTELKQFMEKALEQKKLETNDVRLFLRKLGQQDKFLLLLLDDFGIALQESSDYSQAEIIKFLYEFRDLAVYRQESRYLASVVTSYRRLNEVDPQMASEGSHWYNHYLFKLLKPFSDQEAKTIFFREESPLYIPIAPKLRSAILKITDGHPALLQNAGYLLHSALRDGEIVDIDRFMLDFYQQTKQIFQGIWRSSNETEQGLLMLIALENAGGYLNEQKYIIRDLDRAFSQKQRELMNLEERGIIKSQYEDEKAIYYFASSMMEWWVIQEIQNSNHELIKEREKIFRGLIGRRGFGQINNIVNIIKKNPETAQKVFKLIRKILSGL